MIWFVVVITMTIEARVRLNEIPTDTYPSLWLDTELLDAEWLERYGTEPPDCWFVIVGEKPMPCNEPETPEIKKGPPLDS